MSNLLRTCSDARIVRRSLWTPFRLQSRSNIGLQVDRRSQRSLSDIKHIDKRSRLSQIWAPSGGITATPGEDAHSKLIRGGFLRQAHSGIFHLLPLGQRVQRKIKSLVDRYMSSIGASKVELSSISSEELWARSGRLSKVDSELFRFKDRKDAGYLLSPTHEEEITTLVAAAVKSYKELPIRLYQISRKYRDELRPRHGLLRSREFVMKDLYTFDYSVDSALTTYHQVRASYAALFDELKIAYLVAEADSGAMGGDLSHEFHFPTPKGEDHVMSCDSCDYVANEEKAETAIRNHWPKSGSEWTFVKPVEESAERSFTLWRGISQDRSKLINVWYANESGAEVNTHAVKATIPDLDPGIEDAGVVWTRSRRQTPSSVEHTVVNLVDYRVPLSVLERVKSFDSGLPYFPDSKSSGIPQSFISTDPSGRPLNLLRISEGDPCPRCTGGTLKIQKAIELGHTFFLGTRYSIPLQAMISLPSDQLSAGTASPADNRGGNGEIIVPMQMGCHGIGVSRMIGAVAETLADDQGLNWPRAIAPFEVVVVSLKDLDADALDVYDELRKGSSIIDVVVDDRDRSFAWKMKDADLVGYPVLVVIGKKWKVDRTCEVQCRRLEVRQQVPLADLYRFVSELLSQL